MKKIYLSLPFFLFVSALAAQPTIEWQKTLGGSQFDWAKSIHETNDGGYIIAGSTNSNDGDVSGNHGLSDFWLIKVSESGALQWQKSLGGSEEEYCFSMQVTTDGGYIMAGWTGSIDGDVSGNHGGGDFWVVKLDGTGNIEWQKALGGSRYDAAYSIQQTSDGGYIVTGESYSNDGDVSGHHGNNEPDLLVIKLNNVGVVAWQKCYGGSFVDNAAYIQQTNDGGYIVAGTTNSRNGDISYQHGAKGFGDSWILKLSELGELQWQRVLGGSGNEQINSAQQTSDGGYIATGISFSFDGDLSSNPGSSEFLSGFVVKLSNTGAVQWKKSIMFSQSRCIRQTNDGGYILAGVASENGNDVSGTHGHDDFCLIKLSQTGSVQWQKSLGGTSAEDARYIQQTSDGGYIATGITTSNDGDVTGFKGEYDIWIVKL